MQAVALAPADVMRVRLLTQTGSDVSSYQVGTYLSISVRNADPGYGPDLAEEMERIFGEIAFLDGYLGSVVGVNDGLDEEIVSVVHWKSESAFQTLMPKMPPYEVRLYQRIL